eukprot:3303913-Karenia_brevis.AAC.1
MLHSRLYKARAIKAAQERQSAALCRPIPTPISNATKRARNADDGDEPTGKRAYKVVHQSVQSNPCGQRIIERVSTGMMSAIEGIKSARNIVASYGDHGDAISAISKLAVSDESKAHRDFVRYAKCGLQVQTLDVPIVCRDIKDLGGWDMYTHT